MKVSIIISQITTHGELKSNKLNKLRKSDEIPVISMPSFNVDQMLAEEKLNEKQTNLKLAKIGHDYKGILNGTSGYDGAFETSQSCNVDINCAEGNNWHSRQAVCRIFSVGRLLNVCRSNRLQPICNRLSGRGVCPA